MVSVDVDMVETVQPSAYSSPLTLTIAIYASSAGPSRRPRDMRSGDVKGRRVDAGRATVWFELRIWHASRVEHLLDFTPALRCTSWVRSHHKG